MGSYTMATKPVKFLELHYTMTQFLIIADSLSWCKPIKKLGMQSSLNIKRLLLFVNCKHLIFFQLPY